MSFEKHVDWSKERLQMVIFGYCRVLERKLNITVPEEIKDLIHLFGQFYFKWNHNANGNDYVFPDDPMKIEYTASFHSGWSMLALQDYVLSPEHGEKFAWEIQIDRADTGYVFGMGFVSYPMDKSIKRWDMRLKQDKETREQQFGTYICSEIGYIRLYRHVKQSEKSQRIKMIIGSRFKLIFDFEEKECSIYHNDKYCGCLTKRNMPDKIIPTISCYWTLSATCTKFGPI